MPIAPELLLPFLVASVLVTVIPVALAVGLSALLVASGTAYTTVKLAGAAYLIWLGVQAIRSATSPCSPRPSRSPASTCSSASSGSRPTRTS